MNATSYSPGTAGGNKEWLDGVLTILEPEETPFTSMLHKGSDAKSTYYEVVADRLRMPRTTGTREGESGLKGGNKTMKRARFGSYLHRWMDTFSVTDVQQAVSRAGGNAVTDNEYGDSKAKCIRELKRDIEATLLTNTNSVGGGDEEMRTRGAFNWLTLTTEGANGIPLDYQPAAAQRTTGTATLTEKVVNDSLKGLQTQYGSSREYTMLVGQSYLQDIDMFAVQTSATGTAVQHTYPVIIDGGKNRTISMTVKVFESSFGRITVQPSLFTNLSSAGAHNATSALILNRDQWKLTFLENLHAVDDWDDAGGTGGYCKAIGGLFCSMPRGNAYITNSLN